jgi:L-alanine-DL-glutamate epimerase-like enolase superfamily enzyme
MLSADNTDDGGRSWRLFDNPPMPVDGEMTVPAGPGLGLNFAPDLFEKYGIS